VISCRTSQQEDKLGGRKGAMIEELRKVEVVRIIEEVT
jgi:hypothetical protein